MTKLPTTAQKRVRPEVPIAPERRVGLIRLGKVLALGLLLTITTAVIGLAGQTVAASMSLSEIQSTTQTSLGVSAQPIASEAVASGNGVSNARFGQALGLGTLLFWLGLAAVNLRRQGVKDYRSDNRFSPGLNVVPSGAIRS